MSFTALNLITVTGKYLLLNGQPAKGTITFVASNVLLDTVNDEIVYPVEIDATLGPTGTFSIAIPATDDTDLSPTGWTYIVTEKITGSPRSRSFGISVPLSSPGGTLDMADVQPAEPTPGVITYVLLPAFNAHVNDTVAHLPMDELVRQSLLFGSVQV